MQKISIVLVEILFPIFAVLFVICREIEQPDLTFAEGEFKEFNRLLSLTLNHLSGLARLLVESY